MIRVFNDHQINICRFLLRLVNKFIGSELIDTPDMDRFFRTRRNVLKRMLILGKRNVGRVHRGLLNFYTDKIIELMPAILNIVVQNGALAANDPMINGWNEKVMDLKIVHG